MTNNSGYLGPRDLHADKSDFNTQSFLIAQMLGKLCTATLVQIVAVRGGGLAAVGVVDVHPMVAQIDGEGTATPHGVINNVPYMRLQGGANTVIIDPVVGDIGLCVFASRDISQVKATKKTGVPGSRRQFDWADGLYIGGFLGDVPTQYVQFLDNEIKIVSPTKITVKAPNVTIEGATAVTGNLTVSGTIVAAGNVTGAGKSLATHVHGGVTTGASNTTGPI